MPPCLARLRACQGVVRHATQFDRHLRCRSSCRRRPSDPHGPARTRRLAWRRRRLAWRWKRLAWWCRRLARRRCLARRRLAWRRLGMARWPLELLLARWSLYRRGAAGFRPTARVLSASVLSSAILCAVRLRISWVLKATPPAANSPLSAADTWQPPRTGGRRPHPLVMTTCRYSLGTTIELSPERLKRATRLMRSCSSASRAAGASVAKVLSTGP
jgi:hypothetical protein